MKKKKLVAILILFLGYSISYMLISRNGYYMPIAFGAQIADEKTVLASKNIGEKWIPFVYSKDTKFLCCLYYPLIYVDRLFWHQKRPENGALKLRADYPALGS